MSYLRIALFAVAVSTCLGTYAAEWDRFRGPNGSGVADDSAVPTQWSPSANLAWKTPLPGPGVSSPIIVDGKAFVTCYSGYGLDRENPGEIENLTRHLVCVDVISGKKLWQKDVKAALPEDPYSGVGVPAHGYASHTPVSDGKHVYAFFGKSGVYAYDLDGNEVWHAEVGKESDPTKWGSSSSPIIHEDTVIVTASAESQAVIGLDKNTGKELWRQEAEGLDGMWGTPALVQVDDDRTDIVMCVAKELWGLDPSSGKLRWYAAATDAEQSYSSVIMDGTRAFAFTGRGGGSIALDVGGWGNISDSNTVWTGSDTASFGSPVRYGSRIYLVARGVVTVVDSKTGDKVEQVRLRGARRTGGRFGSLDYPSPVVAGNHLYTLNGSGQMFVFALGDKLKQVAVNDVTRDTETFGGTPAVSGGRMVLRSTKHLYCIADKGEKVSPDDTAVAQNDDQDEPQRRPGEGGRGGGRAGGNRFDPAAIFNRMDTNKDGKLTAQELAGSPMANRADQLDQNGDKAITMEEFRSGIGRIFGGGRGGRGGGGGGYERGKDTRPDRPQRPQMAEQGN